MMAAALHDSRIGIIGRPPERNMRTRALVFDDLEYVALSLFATGGGH